MTADFRLRYTRLPYISACRILIFTTLTFSVGNLPLATAATPLDKHASPISQCYVAMDTAIETYQSGYPESAKQQFSQLLTSCNQIPQLHHNLAVIEADTENWEAAIKYLRQSLALDRRASMTQTSLSAIYRYKADRAYQKALKLDSGKTLPPILRMQSSAVQNNADFFAPPVAMAQTELPTAMNPDKLIDELAPVNPDEIAFDVRSWWLALKEQNEVAYLSHFSETAHPSKTAHSAHWNIMAANNATQLPEWQTVSLNIDILDQHALALLEYPTITPNNNTNEAVSRSLLILKKSSLQWKIIKEQLW